MMIRISPLAICGLLLFLLADPCCAGLTSNRSQLEKIKARIDRAETALQNKQRSELNLSRELVLIKKTLEQVNRRVNELKKTLKTLRGKIDQQQKNVIESRRGVKKVGVRLEKRLVALYKEGETGPLKILFSADSPTEMVQQYHYLTKVLQYDKELLEEYQQAIQVQKQQLLGLESLEEEKNKLLATEQQQQLISDKGKRLQIRLLKKARIDKKKLSREIAQLKENASRLKALITKLEREPVTVAEPVAGDFAVGRGKLGWPVDGRVVIGFGQQKDAKLGTYYESNGIEIATPTGNPIHAVAAGKIVYADYFKGYGNLFILSHPGGYHTLYAQTDRMQKKLGSQVSAGDLLGYSGLAGRDSIYFEIRSNGSPVNPLSWLKRR
ncbi:MAG: peptidoglycan DD-metalloendopeptidase family protein [Thermodesulfobacteriota bacterium]|nr:peptidoglycan DD-metalloendopeptidase family protein [Thermodesulfobacteriota bacterium]